MIKRIAFEIMLYTKNCIKVIIKRRYSLKYLRNEYDLINNKLLSFVKIKFNRYLNKGIKLE